MKFARAQFNQHWTMIAGSLPDVFSIIEDGASLRKVFPFGCRRPMRSIVLADLEMLTALCKWFHRHDAHMREWYLS